MLNIKTACQLTITFIDTVLVCSERSPVRALGRNAPLMHLILVLVYSPSPTYILFSLLIFC